MDRRAIIGMTGLAVTGALVSGAAQGAPGDPEFVALWPGTPPGGDHLRLVPQESELVLPDGFHIRLIAGIQTPGFFVYRPARPNGLGLLIIPGGAYAREAENRGARDIADYFTGLGLTCFVLRYRLPGEGWETRETVPLQDAQRAMRLIKSGNYNVDPAKLAVIGFSAGGHLSASLATLHARSVYSAIDGADTRDAKPLVGAHMYPVITMGEGAHVQSRDMLLSAAPMPEAVAQWSLERQARADTAPSFICLAADDAVVPPLPNGVAFFAALRQAKIASELHVFEAGGHAFGIAERGWPQMFMAWAGPHGFKA